MKRFKREDFPRESKFIIVDSPDLCQEAPRTEIRALKESAAKHNNAIDAKAARDIQPDRLRAE